MDEVNVEMISTKLFQESIVFHKVIGNIPLDFNEEFMYTIIEDGVPTIVVDENTTSYMDDDEFLIAMNHEYAHTTGIMDEEDADLFALEYLNDEQCKILTDQWKDRHGHSYEDRENV